MKVIDLDFPYPESLIATEPQRPSRVMWVTPDGKPQEISFKDLIHSIPAGDLLILNDTRVLKRRIYIDDLEILFLQKVNPRQWQVLFPSKKYRVGENIQLPQGVEMRLLQKGLPQIVELSEDVNESYFDQIAELPLPPYIQKARGERHTVVADQNWYQTSWAEKPGSLASPTASLHFSKQDILQLEQNGVEIHKITLHVGLGTFLPVQVDELDQHVMHSEFVSVSQSTWSAIQKAKMQGRKIWVLGTTSVRAVESVAQGLLQIDTNNDFQGLTQLLIQPGFQFQVVDRLLTNFHQPKSTLLALVAAFSDLNKVKECYSWAIQNKFRLFSYGDLSVWIK